MHVQRTFAESFDRFLAFFTILGVASFFWGTSLNMLVIIANNGSTPITGEPDVLVNADGRPRHYAKEGSAILLIIADGIRADFPEIKLSEKRVWGAFRWWARSVDYPIEGGPHMVTIGDILRWAGSALFLLLLFLLCLRIPFRLMHRAEMR